MKKLLALGLMAALVIAPGSSSATASEFWARAVAAWSKGESWKPARMTIAFDELDGKGNVKSSTSTEYALSYRGGETASTILRSVKDGKDVTEKARADQEKMEAGGRSGQDGRMQPEDIIPFSAKVAPALALGEASMSTGSVAIPYEIRDRKSGSIGTVLFGPDGDPLSLQYSLKPLPAMVSEMYGDARFARMPDGAIVVSSFGFAGEGGILFVRMRFSVRMDFSGYARM